MILYSIDMLVSAQPEYTKSKVIIKRSFKNVAEVLFRLLGFQGLRGIGQKAGFFGYLRRKSRIQGGCGRPNAKQRGFPLDVAAGHPESCRYGSIKICDNLNKTM
jgi:hypothetical protein